MKKRDYLSCKNDCITGIFFVLISVFVTILLSILACNSSIFYFCYGASWYFIFFEIHDIIIMKKLYKKELIV